MKKTLVLASNNPKKIKEINELLKEFDVEVKSLKELGLGEPVEDGKTFAENALIKAQKQEKALNAIIKKNVNIWRFKVETNIDYKKYKSNNILYHDVYNGNLLTEGEFNSIMEVVKCLKS